MRLMFIAVMLFTAMLGCKARRNAAGLKQQEVVFSPTIVELNKADSEFIASLFNSGRKAAASQGVNGLADFTANLHFYFRADKGPFAEIVGEQVRDHVSGQVSKHRNSIAFRGDLERVAKLLNAAQAPVIETLPPQLQGRDKFRAAQAICKSKSCTLRAIQKYAQEAAADNAPSQPSTPAPTMQPDSEGLLAAAGTKLSGLNAGTISDPNAAVTLLSGIQEDWRARKGQIAVSAKPNEIIEIDADMSGLNGNILSIQNNSDVQNNIRQGYDYAFHAIAIWKRVENKSE